jgi:hypothetical protein
VIRALRPAKTILLCDHLQQLAQFSQSNEKECEQQIEQLTLSATNLRAVTRVRRESVWAMGLLTDNDVLFGQDPDEEPEESYHSAYGDMESQRDGDEHDDDAHEEGEDRFHAVQSKKTTKNGRRGRPRNLSTATNASDGLGWLGWESPTRSSSPTPSLEAAGGAESSGTESTRRASSAFGVLFPTIAGAIFAPVGTSAGSERVAETALSPLHAQSGGFVQKSASSPELSAMGKVQGVEMV